MLCRMALVRSDVSEERITSVIGVKRISELGTMLITTNNIVFLRSVLRLVVTVNVVLISPIIFL
jgi:hypothetical protein